MRYFRASQAAESDIRCSVPNHRSCPYLPETKNVKDFVASVGRKGFSHHFSSGTATQHSVHQDSLLDRHPGWRESQGEIANSPHPMVDVLVIN